MWCHHFKQTYYLYEKQCKGLPQQNSAVECEQLEWLHDWNFETHPSSIPKHLRLQPFFVSLQSDGLRYVHEELQGCNGSEDDSGSNHQPTARAICAVCRLPITFS